MKYLLLVLSIWAPALVMAADGSVQTRSAGGYHAPENTELEQQVAEAPLVTLDAVAKDRNTYTPTLSQRTTTTIEYQSHALPVTFDIFDAWVELSGDRDFDGFFHRINVVFDADVSTPLETVYTKLYLSREGGPWVQYASSELFEIHYDETADTYEVVTELVDGYVPAYYDVLIELHALNFDGVVASRVVTLDDTGALISLEDSGFDEPYYEAITTVETTTYGAGSFSAAGLVMYLMLLWVKLRYFPSQRAESRA